jgi:AcrR family transcriptional regulator
MTAHSAAERGTGDKRERILSAAERIFARHGFFAAKVSDVAKEAGVADGTIYLYFKSKDDLLISYFERRMQQLNELLIAATASVAPSEQLHTFIRTYLQLVHDEPTAAEVLTIELRQSSKFMKEYENPEFADFLRLLGRAYADPAPFIRQLLSDQYGEMIARFKAAFARALPQMPRKELSWRLHFIMGALSYTLAGTDALKLIAELNPHETTNDEILLRRLAPFLLAGLTAPLPDLSAVTRELDGAPKPRRR